MSANVDLKNVKFDANKALAIGIVAIVVVGVVIGVYYWIKSLVDKGADKRSLKESKEKAESNTGTVVTESLDFDDICSSIYRACDGLGTDEELLNQTMLRLRTQADYEYLRGHWKIWFNNLSWYQRNGMYSLSESLDGTISSELDSDERDHLRTLLAAKGITPDF